MPSIASFMPKLNQWRGMSQVSNNNRQMVPAKKFRAQDLAARHGVLLEELIKFQKHGVLKPHIDDGGFYYSSADELRLQIALKGLRLGFTLREIAATVAIVAGMSAASLMIHLSSLCPVCLPSGTLYVDVFFRIVI